MLGFMSPVEFKKWMAGGGGGGGMFHVELKKKLNVFVTRKIPPLPLLIIRNSPVACHLKPQVPCQN